MFLKLDLRRTVLKSPKSRAGAGLPLQDAQPESLWTWCSWLTDAAEGLRSLATWDADGDGKITADDPVYGQLKVWQDYNQDAKNTDTFSVNSASGVQIYQVQDESGGVKELRSLAELGIAAIDQGNGRYEMRS